MKKKKQEEKEKIKKQDIEDDINAEEISVEEKLEVLNDKYLRLHADFINFRTRMQKEKIEMLQYMTESIIIDFLDVMDNFDRAIDSVSDTTDAKAVVEGIKFVQKQFHNVLEQRGLKPMESFKGKKFDANFHDALSSEERDDVKEGVILEEFQKGYFLNDKIIRHVKVKVAKKREEKEEKKDE